MNRKVNPSLRSMVALGALVLLAVAATGCGALPTAPDIDSNSVHARGAVTATNGMMPGHELLEGDSPETSSPSTTEAPPAPEIQVPTPGHSNGNGWARGHYKNKHRP